jgi:predicted XRE-type DNA-binding protein
MRKRKQERLEAAGWKVGSAEEFLELSEEEAELVELRLTLARAFKELRTKKGLTQSQAARLVKSSQSRIAMLERGDSSVSIDLIMRGLIYLGSTRKQIGRAIGSADASGRHATA